VLLLSGCASSAENEWQRICKRIESNEVQEVRVLIDEDIYCIDIVCLSKDDFVTEHPKDTSPPTPYFGRIVITFFDGEVIYLYNWETECFSINYRNQYYEIINEELFGQLKDLHS
jgi:hypothetical protein